MAILSPFQIRTYIQGPQYFSVISEAKRHEAEISSYCSPYRDGDSPKSLEKAKAMLVKERGIKVEERWENYTAALVDEVKRHFEKIFEAEGGFEKVRFARTEEETDLNNYLKNCFESTPGKLNGLSVKEYFRLLTKNVFFHTPNTVLIIDHPPLKDNEDGTFTNLITKEKVLYNTPYVTSVGVGDIHDIEISTRGIEYLILKRREKVASEKKETIDVYYVYDDEKYVVYKKTKGGKLRKVSEQAHSFGKCPARHIVQAKLFNNLHIKKSLLSSAMPYLESWQIFRVFTEIYKHESGFSERIVPESKKCAGVQEQTGLKCKNGFVLDTTFVGTESQPYLYPCEKCKRKSQEKHSFGKQYEIDIAKIIEGAGDRAGDFVRIFTGAFQRIDADKDILEFHANNLTQGEEQIKTLIKGQGFNQSKSKEALNEKHVDANLEDQRKVLSEVAEQIEVSWQWCVEMIAKSRYSSFQSYQKFLGRDYILDNANALNSFSKIREMGMDDYVLNQESFKILQKRVSDKHLLEVWKILMTVIPFRHMTLDQVYNNHQLLTENQATRLSFYVRVYAANWLEEFDIANNLRFFGSNITPQRRVEIIKKYFYEKALSVAQEDTESLFGIKSK